MIKIFIPLFLSISLIFLITGCNDSPTDLGKDFVNGLDGIAISSFDSDSANQHSKTIERVIALGSSTRLLLGKTDNLTAGTLLRFYFSLDTTVIGRINRNEIIVLDSWVDLYKEYRFGDSAASFDYSVHKITNNWNSTTFTSDSLTGLQFESADISSQRGTANDTIYSFHIGTEVPLFWLQHYANADTNYNYGLYITPAPNSQKILGFSGYGTSSGDEPGLKVVIKNSANEIDTISGYIVSDVSIVDGDPASVGNENFAVQSSFASEGYIYFDLSSLPEHYAPNDAQITLTIDTLLTKLGTSYSTKLVAYLVADSVKDSVDSKYSAVLTRENNTIKGSLLNIVRGWKSGLKNKGIIIKSYTEYYGVELIAIRGSNAALVSERPKLKILYSKR